MSQLPPAPPPGFPPPPTLGYAPPPGPAIDLRAVATRQRMVIFCILVYIVLAVTQVLVPREVQPFVALALLAVAITAAVFVFMLALTVYTTGTGILLGILTLIPCVGLIVLLIINGKATSVLRAHGLKVGLLGANPSQLPPRGVGVL